VLAMPLAEIAQSDSDLEAPVASPTVVNPEAPLGSTSCSPFRRGFSDADEALDAAGLLE